MATATLSEQSPSRASSIRWCAISVLALPPLMWMASIFSELDDGIVGSTTSLALQVLLAIGPLMFAADAIMIGKSSAETSSNKAPPHVVALEVEAAQQAGADPAVAIVQTVNQLTRRTPLRRMPGIDLYKTFLTVALSFLGLLLAAAVAFFMWWTSSGASDCFLGC